MTDIVERLRTAQKQEDVFMDDLDEAADTIEQLNEQLAAQAATIKQLKGALEEQQLEYKPGTIGYNDIAKALAIPANSTEVLQQWLDGLMGEPVAEVLTIYPGEDASFMNVTAINVDPYNTWSFPQPGTKLYIKPEIK